MYQIYSLDIMPEFRAKHSLEKNELCDPVDAFYCCRLQTKRSQEISRLKLPSKLGTTPLNPHSPPLGIVTQIPRFRTRLQGHGRGGGVGQVPRVVCLARPGHHHLRGQQRRINAHREPSVGTNSPRFIVLIKGFVVIWCDFSLGITNPPPPHKRLTATADFWCGGGRSRGHVLISPRSRWFGPNPHTWGTA